MTPPPGTAAPDPSAAAQLDLLRHAIATAQRIAADLDADPGLRRRDARADAIYDLATAADHVLAAHTADPAPAASPEPLTPAAVTALGWDE